MANEWSAPEASGTRAPAVAQDMGGLEDINGIVDLTKESWRRLAANPGPAVLGLVGGFVVSGVGMVVWYVAFIVAIGLIGGLGAAVGGAAGSEDAAAGLASVGMVLAMVVLYPPLIAVMMVAQVIMMRGGLATARGEAADVGSLTSGLARKALRATGMTFLMILALIPAALLLYIPAIYLGIRWSLAAFYILDSDVGVVDSMKASWRATEGQVLDLFLKYLVFGLGSMFIIIITCYLGMFVVLPVQIVLQALIYMKLSGRLTSGLPDPAPSFG